MSTPSTEQPPPEQKQEYPGRTAEMDPSYYSGEVLAPIGGETLPG